MDRTECEIPKLETLFTAVLYLSTNYAKTGCPMICRMIMRQLACIRNHPGQEVSPWLREACAKLLVEWGRIGVERAEDLHQAATARKEDSRHYH